MAESTWKRTILPCLFFPLFSVLAYRKMWVDASTPSLNQEFVTRCAPQGTYALPYTHVKAVDDILCIVVTFFSAAFEADALYSAWFCGQLIPIFTFFYVEAGRRGRGLLFSAVAVTIINTTCQLVTGGVTLPLYWLLFIFTGRAQTVAPTSATHAFATLLASAIGYILPTIMMVFLREPYSNATWQVFPFLMLPIQQLVLLLILQNPKSSGKGLNRALYIFIFVITASQHLYAMWTMSFNPEELYGFLVPPFYIDKKITAPITTLIFLQWDGVCIFLSAMLASLWFSRSIMETLLIFLWNVTAGIALGPAAALSAVYAWREGRMAGTSG